MLIFNILDLFHNFYLQIYKLYSRIYYETVIYMLANCNICS